MNSRQKRSNGGYGLRRKIARKRLDEDFEYYFSKIGSHLDMPATKPVKEQRENKVHTHLVSITEFVDPTVKSDVKVNESPEKRPRGRPKKIYPNQNQQPDFSDSTLKIVDLKEKKPKKFRAEYLNETETSKTGGEICPKREAILTVACEEEFENVDCIVKRIKLETVLASDDMTDLQEEEVSSLPEGEKENLPEDGIHLETESDPEEGLGVQIDAHVHADLDEGAVFETEHEGIENDTTVLKMKRKYKKGRLSQDAIQKLSQLSPDDKVECNECHKLLKPSSFRQHLRTHTGEKPFGCEVCDARFTRKGDVERHVRIVHNKQKPFKCCRCQRAFGDKKNLRWHLMNHDKKLFYVCEACGFKFGKREYWENHVRFIHPIPGGLELGESNIEKIGDDVETEDRLRTLTKTLLGEDESVVDDPSQDCAAAVKSIQSKEDTVSPEMIPYVNHVSKQEGMKIINVKNLNLSSLVKMGQSKMDENVEPYSQVINQNQGGGIEAVVIQFDGSDSEGSALQSLQHVQPRFQQQLAPNLIHVVNSQDVLQIVEAEGSQEQESIVIETQDYDEGAASEPGTCPSDVVEEQVVGVQEEVLSTGGGDSGTVQYVSEADDEPSKVISIMLTEDGGAGGDTSNSSVQTLIEALLVAAKDGQNNDIQST
ncbi:hypothetical protein Cfor_03676 [Coptotermes formosanus]|uniref:C2H2-type domain-containing protein n=1 Tax=Coptotermes formosanus TaxID=36987 RepID=A0A6L2PD07_COPFO|nr:hypothetical protein Cfor_03676 [Coptotermes formosanus]